MKNESTIIAVDTSIYKPFVWCDDCSQYVRYTLLLQLYVSDKTGYCRLNSPYKSMKLQCDSKPASRHVFRAWHHGRHPGTGMWSRFVSTKLPLPNVLGLFATDPRSLYEFADFKIGKGAAPTDILSIKEQSVLFFASSVKTCKETKSEDTWESLEILDAEAMSPGY